MNNQDLKLKLKIGGILIMALVISEVTSKTIFLAKTPRINKVFISKVINTPGNILNNSKQFIASLVPGTKENMQNMQNQAIQQFQKLPATAMYPISQGVYAAGDTNARVVYIKVDPNAQWEERIMTVDGKQVKVRFPKGTFSK